MLDLQHVAVGQAVAATHVDGDHAVAAHHGHAPVDRDDAAVQVLDFGRAGHEVHVLVDAGRHQTVTVGDLFHHLGDGQPGRIAMTLQFGRAQEGGLIGQRLAGHRIDERLGRAIDVPGADTAVGLDATGVDAIGIADVHPAFLFGGDDVGRVIQALLVDDQRTVDEGLDARERDAGDGGLVGHGGAHGGLQLADAVAVATLGTGTVGAAIHIAAQTQARRVARTIQIYNVARIDQVRVLDLGLVKLPDLRPAPGFLQKKSGNAPQRVTLDHHMAVRGVGGQLDLILAGLGDALQRHHGARGKGNAQAQGAQGPGAKLFHRHGRSLESSTHAPPG